MREEGGDLVSVRCDGYRDAANQSQSRKRVQEPECNGQLLEERHEDMSPAAASSSRVSDPASHSVSSMDQTKP